MHLARKSWQRWSLRVKLTITITAVATISVLASTMLFVYNGETIHRQELQNQANLLLSALQVTTMDALYTLNADFLEDLVEDLSDSEAAILAAVYDQEGRLIADSQTDEALIYMAHPDPLGQRLINLDNAITEWQSDYLLVGKPVKVGRHVIGAISLKISTKPLVIELGAVRNRGIAVAFGSAAIGAVLALLLSRSVTQPLRELTQATERIVGGDFAQRVMIHTADEVGALAMGFNHMAIQVQGHIEHLEELVQLRTQELAIAKERAESILNHSVDGIFLAHTDLRIQQTNLAFNQLFNCELDAYFNRSLLDLIVETDVQRVKQVIQASMVEQTGSHIETQAHRRDGTIFDTDLSIGTIKGYGLVCTLHDISQRKQAEAALTEKIRQERELLAYLKTLHDISIELTQIEDLNVFYRRSVELGLEHLGFERLALFLYNSETGTAIGTYGTDQQGQLIDERHLRFMPQRGGIMERALLGEEHFHIDTEVPLFENREAVGTGWNAASILWNGSESQGWFVSDNLLTHKPVSKAMMEILSLYSMTVGTLLAQKKAQAALRESEERFRQIAENIDQVLFIRSSDDQKLLYVNPAYETLWSQSCDSLYEDPNSFMKPVHPQDQDYVYNQRISGAYVETGRADYEYRIIRSDGGCRWVRVRTFPILATDGTINRRMGIVDDITESKEAQKRLAEERNLLRNLIDTIPEHIYIKDLEHRFVLTNMALARSHGCMTPDELTGKTDYDILPAALADEYQAQEMKIFQTSLPQMDREEPSRGYSGGFEWALSTKMPLCNLQGELIGLVGINRDITERKKRERQMRFDASIQASVSDAVIVTDLDFNIQSWNTAAQTIFGWCADEVIGKPALEILPTRGGSELDAKREREKFDAQGVWQGEIIQPHKDGHELYLLASVNMLKDEHETPIGIIAISRDISERKQVEEALRQALAKEQELNELKSRFVSMASHEFRTPLATILALTETIIAYRQKLSVEQVDQRLFKIQNQVEHLKNIMEDVLQLARIQARRERFNPELLDLDGLCRSVLDEFQSRSDISHHLIYTCDPALREVKLDKRLMRQVINNLVSNAIKYSPSDKPVTIQLQRTSEAIVLTIQDEGIGIPQDDLPHLFEPFHRAANVGTISGTGLGLVISKESVELHSGTITVESQVNMGTTFVVRIPIEIGA